MFDIGWSEMLIVGVVALIVVGPKDLPKMFHTLGEVTGKARGMAREFQRAMDAAAKETGVSDIVKDFKRTTSGQGLKDATGFGDIEKEFRDIDKTAKNAGKNAAGKPGAGSILNPNLPAQAEASDLDFDDDEAAHLADESDAARREAKIAAHEAEVAARNAKIAATEAERLKRAEKAAAARLKAAEIRARREAAPQTPDAES